jgi:PAS domain S-box-containing protein
MNGESGEGDRNACDGERLGEGNESAQYLKLQQSLEAAWAPLLTLIDNVPDFIFQKDREGRFVFANRSLANVVGVSDPKDMIGKTASEVFPREIAEKFVSDDQAVIESGNPLFNIEQSLISASGLRKWVLTTKVPLLDSSEHVTGLVGIGRDITERKELEKKNQQLAALVEYAGDAIVGIDPNRRITVWNRAAEHLYEYSAGEMIGAPTSLLIPPELEDEVRLMWDRVMQEGQVTRYETTRLRKDGSRIIISLTLSAIHDVEGRIVGIASVARDITEGKQAEKMLKESEEKFHLLFERSADGNLILDNGRFIDCNEVALRIAGFTVKEQLIGLRHIDISPERQPDDESSFAKAERLTALAYEKGSYYFEWMHKRFSGSEIALKVLLTAIPMKGRRLLHVTWRDISTDKYAEKALQESEQRCRSLVENCNEGVFVVQDGILKYVNRAVLEIVGRSEQEISFKPFLELIHPDDRAMVGEHQLRRLRGEELESRYTFRFIGKNGDIKWIELGVALIPFNGRPATLNIVTDITERKQAEQVLRESERRLSDIVDFLPDATFVIDTKGTITAWNRAMEQMTGKTKEQMLGCRNYEYAIPFYGRRRPMLIDLAFDNREEIKEKYAFFERREDTLIAEAFTPLLHEGKGAHFGGTATFLRNEKGMICGAIESIRDISDRKKAVEALQESEKKYHLLLDTLNEGVWAIDKYDATMFVNARMASMMGYAEDELLGRNVFDFLHAPSLTAERQLASGKRPGILGQFDGEFLRKDGTRIITRLKIAPVVGDGGEYLGSIASVIDITEQRKAENEVQRLQEQLLQAQKMEAIGQLAGGVAHDFNNLLTIILGNVELIRMEKSSRGIIEEISQEIQKAGLRAAELTHQLLAFGRKQMLQPKVFNLNSLVENLSKMLRRLIGENITLELRLDATLGSVRADPGQIEQVIINLAANARDAMSDGGKLVLETRNAAADEVRRSERIEISPDPYVILTLSDIGVGMDEKVKAHLFEPFFTTKEPGKGTGLGLSTVYGIVKQSGGYIFVDSQPGRGTSFTIAFPRVNTENASREAPPIERRPIGGTERILIVEDEPSVLRLATTMLQGFGYAVLGALAPGEALSLPAIGEKRGVDLLITDVVLPGMNGTELARRMQACSPDLRVLFISGYADEMTFREGVLTTGNAFLPKPFTTNMLVKKVREVLDSSRTRVSFEQGSSGNSGGTPRGP